MPTQKPVYVLNGPNLNMLGLREPAIYGHETLADVEAQVRRHANALGLAIEFRQTNYEGELVTWIQEARDKACGILLNAGALTHTSVAVLDALNAAELPAIEVHLSNVFRREAFRHHSYVSLAAVGVVCGFGAASYTLALDGLSRILAGKTGDKSPSRS
ncbi:MAG: type II 3-dehydroquinate dehydratase [Hyphomicrobiaceae bacterium]